VSRPLQHDGQRIKSSPAQSDAAGEASGAVIKRLDGKIDSVAREIVRLHNEIKLARDEVLAVFKSALPKAIRIGELLTRIRASRKGKWVTWLADNAPFSQATAYNYIGLYDRKFLNH
jgi:hypothetical protein